MDSVLPALIVVLFLAFANGANDNFKGVATLYGSGKMDYRSALIWATITTGLGSIAALVLAKGLIAAFSGKGLVPDSVVLLKSFSLAVGFSAAATVMLATKLGFPISSTHALTGALAGAGFFASPAGVNLSKLATSFLGPLLASPIAAVAIVSCVYPLFQMFTRKRIAKDESCICVGEVAIEPSLTNNPAMATASMYLSKSSSFALETGTIESCDNTFDGRATALTASKALNAMHYLSGGVVGFARGLNDTPKIAAILLAGSALPTSFAVLFVGLFIAVGGLLNSRKVAETMSKKVMTMDPTQGLTANVVTGFLVVFASKWGLPVSTTHVSCGSIFGIGAVTRRANFSVIFSILLAWITTLPLAALLGALFFQTFVALGVSQ